MPAGSKNQMSLTKITAFILLTVLLSACSQTPEEKAQKLFELVCTRGGVDSEVCSCSYTKLAQKYPTSFFLGRTPGEVPPAVIQQFSHDMITAGLICKNELFGTRH